MERFQAAGEEVDFDPFEGEEPAQAEPAPPAAPAPAPGDTAEPPADYVIPPRSSFKIPKVVRAPEPEQPKEPGPKFTAGEEVDFDPFAEKPNAVSNVVRGVGERAIELVGGTAGTIGDVSESIGDWLDENLGRVGVGGDNMFGWRQLTPEETKGRSSWITQKLEEVRQGMKNPDLGYDPRTTWQDVKDAPLTNVIPFAVESGLVSLPDMIAAVKNVPAYVLQQTGEIGAERAANEGRTEPTFGDLVKALPAATISAMMEKFGTEAAKADDKAVAEVYAKAGAKVYDINDAVLKQWQAIARDTAWKDYGAKSETCAALLKAAQKLA